MAGRDRTFAAPPLLLQTRLLLGCANLHALDRHWMPYRHAAGPIPALGLVPAGLACENQQSGRVHLEPNLQAVAGTVVLSLQAGHEPQKVGVSGPQRAANARAAASPNGWSSSSWERTRSTN